MKLEEMMCVVLLWLIVMSEKLWGLNWDFRPTLTQSNKSSQIGTESYFRDNN